MYLYLFHVRLHVSCNHTIRYLYIHIMKTRIVRIINSKEEPNYLLAYVLQATPWRLQKTLEHFEIECIEHLVIRYD